MIVRITFLSVLFALISIFSASAQEFSVNWLGLKNAVVNGTSLERDPLAENKGVGTSSQVLFGKGAGNVFEGYLKYVVNNTSEIKKIGFVVLNDPGEQVGTLDYGFSFLKNGKVRAFSPDEVSSKIAYNAGDEFKIGRESNDMVFYINGVEVYRVLGSIMEDLTIRADLKSTGSSFDNVLSSFETTHFCVRAFVDNVNKTIELGITGAFPPYKYAWVNGSVFTDNPRTKKGGPVFRSFVNGIYTVKITDSQGDAVTRMFSVGEDAVYTNFYESTVTGNTLQTSTGQGWGGATVTNTFASTFDAWAEYLINKQTNGKKAFGFSDVGTQIRKPRNIKAGFLVSRDNIQVLFNGNVVLTEDYDDKDALNIQYVGGVVSWFRNGVEIYTADYVANGDINLVGLVRNGGTLENLTYDVNPQLYVSSVWDETAQNGEITVDISDIGIIGPFRYVISQERIPDLSEVYTYLTTDLGLTIDQGAFMTAGTEMSTNFSFSNLPSGQYFISVFDNYGDRILGKTIQLQGSLDFDIQSGLLSQGVSVMTSGLNAGAGSLVLFTGNGVDAELEFEVSRKNQEREQFFGLALEGITVNTFADLQYGFFMTGRRLFTVVNGSLSSTPTIIRNNKVMVVAIENGVLTLKANDEIVETITLSGMDTYKVGIGTEKGGAIKVKPMNGFVKAPATLISSTKLGSCFGSFGEINASLTVWQTSIATVGNVQFSLSDELGNPISATAVNSLSADFTDLTQGLYTLMITFDNFIFGNLVSSSVQTKLVTVYARVSWANKIESDYVPLTEGLIRTDLTSGSDIGAAQSNHGLNTTENKVFFELDLPGVSDYAITNWSDQIYTSVNAANFEGLLFFKFFGGGPYVYNTYDQVYGSALSSYLLELNYDKSTGNSFLLGHQGANVTTLAFSLLPVVEHLNAFPSQLNTGFINVSTNMPCRTPKTYAKLERKLRGVKYNVYENEIRFYVDEEYESLTGLLNYRIYSSTDNVSPVQTNANVSKDVDYGDNRYSLDVSALLAGSYVLEVENDKKEKFYLRFIKP